MFGIIALMQERGYSPNKEGMCYGISGMASQAVVRGDGFTFANRIKEIKNNNITLETIKKFQIDAFLDGVYIYMGDADNVNHALIFNKGQNISTPSHFFAPSEGELSKSEFYVPLQTHKFLSRFDKYSLMSFLEKVKDKNQGLAFSVLILFSDHSVQIGFDNTKWLSVNHDFVKYESELSKVIDNVLVNDERSSDIFQIATVQVLSSSHSLKLRGDKITYDASNINTLSLNELAQFIRLALRDNHNDYLIPHIIKEISKKTSSITERYDCLFIKGSDENPVISSAFRNGHEDPIKVLFDGFITLRFTAEQIFTLLEAKDENGVPGLLFALQYGHEEVLKVFIEYLNIFNLTNTQKFNLLLARDRNGIEGLFLAIQNGHKNTVKCFLECIGLIDFTNIQKMDLLAAKDGSGVPGLFMALQNGDDKTVSFYIEALHSHSLTSDEIMDLLSVKNRDGTSGLFLAFALGHHAVVSTFIKGLHLLGLTVEQIVELLLAKNRYGTTGLFVALENGNFEVAMVLYHELNSLGLSHKKIEELFGIIIAE